MLSTMANDTSLPSNLTKTEFVINVLPLNVLLFIGGLFSAATNLLVSASISRLGEQRNRTDILLYNLSIANVLSSLSFVEWGLLAILQQGNAAFGTVNSFVCVAAMLPGMLSLSAQCSTVLAMSVDRLAVTVAPVLYGKTKKYVYNIVCCICWAIGTVLAICAISFSNQTEKPPLCYMNLALDASTHNIWDVFVLFTNVSAMICILLSVMVVKLKSTRNGDSTSAAGVVRRKHVEENNRLLSCLGVIVGFDALTWLCYVAASRLPLQFSADDGVLFHSQAYAQLSLLVNLLSTFFVCFVRHRDLRNRFLALLCFEGPELERWAVSVKPDRIAGLVQPAAPAVPSIRQLGGRKDTLVSNLPDSRRGSADAMLNRSASQIMFLPSKLESISVEVPRKPQDSLRRTAVMNHHNYNGKYKAPIRGEITITESDF